MSIASIKRGALRQPLSTIPEHLIPYRFLFVFEFGAAVRCVLPKAGTSVYRRSCSRAYTVDRVCATETLWLRPSGPI